MNKNIAAFPLTEAFRAGDECPFCNLERSAEQHAISFILGSAYMEDDIRAATDAQGFCRHHYKMMYDYGNRLGSAWILSTHLKKLNEELAKELKKDSEFQELFRQSKGFCLPHFADLIEAAETRLSDAQKKELYPQIFDMMQTNMERVQKDVAWFVEKNDYRNKDKDWGESRDSIQRAMQKCTGGYPADPVFKLEP